MGDRITLTPAQRAALEFLEKRGSWVGKQDMDGRAARALLSRGWAQKDRRGLRITDDGRCALREGVTKSAGGARRKSSARGQAVLQAVARLEQAVPQDSELAIGPMFAHIDDVLAGLRKLAQRMDRSK